MQSYPELVRKSDIRNAFLFLVLTHGCQGRFNIKQLNLKPPHYTRVAFRIVLNATDDIYITIDLFVSFNDIAS